MNVTSQGRTFTVTAADLILQRTCLLCGHPMSARSREALDQVLLDHVMACPKGKQ